MTPDKCGSNWGLDFKSPEAPQLRLVGLVAKGQQARLAKASPTSYVASGNPPFLILHGDKDNVVPIAQSEELLRLLKSSGVDCRLTIVKGAGHNFADPESLEAVVSFFNQKLKH